MRTVDNFKVPAYREITNGIIMPRKMVNAGEDHDQHMTDWLFHRYETDPVVWKKANRLHGASFICQEMDRNKDGRACERCIRKAVWN
jgi:hypothetical protein